MPTVLRVGGFRVVIFLPPREHDPPHVHVVHADGEAVFELKTGEHPVMIRSAFGLRDADVYRAYRLVEQHAEYLLRRWRELHG